MIGQSGRRVPVIGRGSEWRGQHFPGLRGLNMRLEISGERTLLQLSVQMSGSHVFITNSRFRRRRARVNVIKG